MSWLVKVAVSFQCLVLAGIAFFSLLFRFLTFRLPLRSFFVFGSFCKFARLKEARAGSLRAAEQFVFTLRVFIKILVVHRRI